MAYCIYSLVRGGEQSKEVEDCFRPVFSFVRKLPYRVQGVPTCLGLAKCNILKLRSLPAKITNLPKKRILLHKIAFSAFFSELQN